MLVAFDKHSSLLHEGINDGKKVFKMISTFVLFHNFQAIFVKKCKGSNNKPGSKSGQ
jgi:hypothetical protein